MGIVWNLKFFLDIIFYPLWYYISYICNNCDHTFSLALYFWPLWFCHKFMAGAASQAGDADSSQATGLTSGLQGYVNVHRGALLLVPQWRCISYFVFYSSILLKLSNYFLCLKLLIFYLIKRSDYFVQCLHVCLSHSCQWWPVACVTNLNWSM